MQTDREVVEEALVIAGLHPDPNIKPRVVSVKERVEALKFLINARFGTEEEAQCLCQCRRTEKDSQ